MSLDEFWRLTARGWVRECAAERLRQSDRLEELTYGAYQTIRVWVLTKNKKKMPRFADLIIKPNAAPSQMGPEKARAMLEVLAARAGGKVRSRANTLVSQARKD